MPRRFRGGRQLTKRKAENNRPALVLFRDDLRVADNRALSAAAGTGKPIVAAYVLDEESPGMRAHGGASRWWLHHALAALAASLRSLGVPLVLRHGTMLRVVEHLAEASGAYLVLWNRRYDPGGTAADAAMKAALREAGVRAESFDGRLLHEPSLVGTASGSFYKVYTPFWKAISAGPEPRDPVPAPKALRPFDGVLATDALEALLPLPKKPDWAGGLRDRWTPGEKAAHAQLAAFLDDGLDAYADRRDFAAEDATSHLSPYLAHGEITPFQILAAVKDKAAQGEGAAKFRKEIAWREFCYHLLFHNPRLHEENFRDDFDAFPWRDDEEGLHAWQCGLTGYPIVDAGMRELWHTGTMHNRVRMVAASFLTKHLLIDWRRGERWFWDTLVDADLASNPGNWQWVAGCGADAAPYFRIFNPVLQGERFDPGGGYVRRWLPALGRLPDRYVHKPWTAPQPVLSQSGLSLGDDYPRPIVDHDAARRRALSAWRGIGGGA